MILGPCAVAAKAAEQIQIPQNACHFDGGAGWHVFGGNLLGPCAVDADDFRHSGACLLLVFVHLFEQCLLNAYICFHATKGFIEHLQGISWSSCCCFTARAVWCKPSLVGAAVFDGERAVQAGQAGPTAAPTATAAGQATSSPKQLSSVVFLFRGCILAVHQVCCRLLSADLMLGVQPSMCTC